MERNWILKNWNGKCYVKAMEFEANGAKQAIKKAGFDDPIFTCIETRKGYNYFVGKISVYLPETLAANVHHADFIIEVI
jgi:hypothetical protein